MSVDEDRLTVLFDAVGYKHPSLDVVDEAGLLVVIPRKEGGLVEPGDGLGPTALGRSWLACDAASGATNPQSRPGLIPDVAPRMNEEWFRMNDRRILTDALTFHGHRCWASVVGVRTGLAALRTLEVRRSGGTQLYAIVEIGEEHGAMCFADGVQYTTGCTFGKGNLRKNPLGKLAVTLIDKGSDRAVRVSYKPTLAAEIAASAFVQQRAAGVQPDEIPETDQAALVDLVWDAPESDIMTIGEPFSYEQNWLPEVMGFTPCESCGEFVAFAYVRLAGHRKLCIPCSGYDR